MRKPLAGLAVAAVLVLGACGGKSSTSAAPTTATSTTPSTAGEPRYCQELVDNAAKSAELAKTLAGPNAQSVVDQVKQLNQSLLDKAPAELHDVMAAQAKVAQDSLETLNLPPAERAAATAKMAQMANDPEVVKARTAFIDWVKKNCGATAEKILPDGG